MLTLLVPTYYSNHKCKGERKCKSLLPGLLHVPCTSHPTTMAQGLRDLHWLRTELGERWTIPRSMAHQRPLCRVVWIDIPSVVPQSSRTGLMVTHDTLSRESHQYLTTQNWLSEQNENSQRVNAKSESLLESQWKQNSSKRLVRFSSSYCSHHVLMVNMLQFWWLHRVNYNCLFTFRYCNVKLAPEISQGMKSYTTEMSKDHRAEVFIPSHLITKKFRLLENLSQKQSQQINKI